MTQIIHVSGFGMKAQMSRARKRLKGGQGAKRGGLMQQIRSRVRPHPQAEVMPGETPLNISGFETEAEMDLKLHRQGLEIERNIAISVAGIGSPIVANLNASIARYSEAIAALENPNPEAAIGLLKKLKKAAKKATSAVKKVAKKAGSTAKKATRAVRQGKLIKKVVKTAGKVAKGAIKTAGKVAKFAAKAITAPMRLAVKAISEVLIPKMAPMFIYLFVTNPTTISKLPAKVQRKRKKSERFAKFMTNVIGMKEAHFMKLVRNGIMRKYGKTPEQLLAGKVNGSISGVGVIPAAAAILPVVLEVIKKLATIFGKKASPDETPGEDDIPDLEADFEEATPRVRRTLAAHLRYKPASQRGEEPGDYEHESRELREEESVYRQIEMEPEETPYDAPLPDPEPEPGENFEDEYYEEEENFTKSARKSSGTVTDGSDSPEESKGINPLFLVGGGLIAAKVLTS